jgi:hypothetical protein
MSFCRHSNSNGSDNEEDVTHIFGSISEFEIIETNLASDSVFPIEMIKNSRQMTSQRSVHTVGKKVGTACRAM